MITERFESLTEKLVTAHITKVRRNLRKARNNALLKERKKRLRGESASVDTVGDPGSWGSVAGGLVSLLSLFGFVR